MSFDYTKETVSTAAPKAQESSKSSTSVMTEKQVNLKYLKPVFFIVYVKESHIYKCEKNLIKPSLIKSSWEMMG